MLDPKTTGYKESMLSIRVGEAEKNMLKIMADIYATGQGELVRKLIRDEASKASAHLDGEQLELWVELLNQVDYEEEKRKAVRALKVGEAESRTRQLTAPKTQDAAYHRKYRANKRVAKYFATLKELKKKYGA